jgi:HSP20 family protein
MNNITSHQTVYSIYPVEYVPLLKEEEVKKELKKTHAGDRVRPSVNIAESPDSFKVEVAMPGMKREELLIHANENILPICAVHKEPAMNHPGTSTLKL